MKLVIVESPTKAKTIGKFLGKGYKVESSFGHVRDLPRSKLGIDVDQNYEVQYLIPKKAFQRVKQLKEEAKKADQIILAADEDREGEAIAWHLQEILTGRAKISRSKKIEKDLSTDEQFKRIVFHEITETAIQEALEHPRKIDMNLVNAQQARRVLDRLVGYKLSPFLWKKLMGGLSAGRVQSVALHIIVMREEEIKSFNPEIYYSVNATLENNVETELAKINGTAVQKMDIKKVEEAEKIVASISGESVKTQSVDEKEVSKNPLAPFTTSTLQQAAANRLGFSAKKTMMFAQRLYESGYITYMRTDSVNLSESVLTSARSWIVENLGEKYASDAPRRFKKQTKLAQEAHEAIRPTRPDFVPQGFGGSAGFESKEEDKLYELIWRRFMASQLPKAQFLGTRAEFAVKGKDKVEYVFSANGNVLKFDGFLKIWPTTFEDHELPQLKEGDVYAIREAKADMHQTEPPPRYSEATLIKTLEKNGIGRPSTYAPTISTIIMRNYVEKIQGRFHPTETGVLVNKMLSEHFPQIVDFEFTANMEEDLDEIAEGKENWVEVIRRFYEPFAELLAKKYEEVVKEEIIETTTEVCDKCGKPMMIKRGRFGKFLACSGYPECKNTKAIKDPPKMIGMKCPKCTDGDVIERKVVRGRARGKMFWGCSKYPDCDYASWTNPKDPVEVKEEGAAKDEKEPKDAEEPKETEEISQ